MKSLYLLKIYFKISQIIQYTSLDIILLKYAASTLNSPPDFQSPFIHQSQTLILQENEYLSNILLLMSEIFSYIK